MPIHLPPLSRRRFLAGSLGVAAAVFLEHPLLAADRETDPHAWALFSDSHIAADRSQISRGANMTAGFEAVSREVRELPRLPAAVLVNGDLAFSTGETGDYAAVIELLRPLRAAGLPIHLTLGNHDERERFWSAFAEVKAEARPVSDRQASLVRSPRANWFILDSLDKVNTRPGILGEAQRAWLAKALDENPDQPALVVCHHDLDATNALKDSEELLAIIRLRKQVKAFIFGHTHDWHTEKDVSGIHLVNLPPTAYVFTPGKPRGWVMASLRSDGARFELHCLDRQHPEHGQVLDLAWRPG